VIEEHGRIIDPRSNRIARIAPCQPVRRGGCIRATRIAASLNDLQFAGTVRRDADSAGETLADDAGDHPRSPPSSPPPLLPSRSFLRRSRGAASCKEKSDSLISHIVARPGHPEAPRCVIARFNHTTSAHPSLARDIVAAMAIIRGYIPRGGRAARYGMCRARHFHRSGTASTAGVAGSVITFRLPGSAGKRRADRTPDGA